MARPATEAKVGAAAGARRPTARVPAAPSPAYQQIAAVRRGTLRESAFTALREAILSGRLFAGQRLVETTLARDLGISRGPLREALVLLQRDGLVEMVPRRGHFVLAFTETAVSNFYDLRKVLECYAVELIIESLDAAKLERLRSAARHLEEAITEVPQRDLVTPDLVFHELIYELSGQPLLHRVWTENMASKLSFLVHVTLPPILPGPEAATNHGEIVEAIARRDRERARHLVTQHLDDALARARAAMAAGQEEAPAAT